MKEVRPHRFRIKLGALHVRVKVYDTAKSMHAAVEGLHQLPCSAGDKAVTVTFEPPEAGMMADLFLYWRSVSRDTISHEALHLAWHWALTTKLGIGADSEERIAEKVGNLTEAIHRGCQRGHH